jgi:phosphate transport system substrate-binding protein
VIAGVIAALLALSLLAACRADEGDAGVPDEPAGETPAATPPPADGLDYGALSGDIRVDGSSTVFPISEAMAEEFRSVAPGVRVNVAFSGTGGGFEKFCRGETEISNASRPIKDDEVQACAENGIEDLVELQIAIDALTVMVNPANDWVECMTVEELHQAFTTAQRWSDIRPEWPEEPMITYYPGADSGTFDYFVETIIEGVDENAVHRGDGTASEDDNVLAQGIAGDRTSIGYFGFAYFLGAGPAIKPVSIDGGNGCVEPSFETALSGEYAPLSRALFIYTSAELLQQRPEVLGFVQFYLDSIEELVPEVGYVSLPPDLLAEQQEKIAPYLP